MTYSYYHIMHGVYGSTLSKEYFLYKYTDSV